MFARSPLPPCARLSKSQASLCSRSGPPRVTRLWPRILMPPSPRSQRHEANPPPHQRCCLAGSALQKWQCAEHLTPSALSLPCGSIGQLPSRPSPATSTHEDVFHWASANPGVPQAGPKPTFQRFLREIQKHRQQPSIHAASSHCRKPTRASREHHGDFRTQPALTKKRLLFRGHGAPYSPGQSKATPSMSLGQGRGSHLSGHSLGPQLLTHRPI